MQLCRHLAVEKVVGETKGFRCQYLNHYIGADLDYWCDACGHYESEDELYETASFSGPPKSAALGICRLCRFVSGCKRPKGQGCEMFTR